MGKLILKLLVNEIYEHKNDWINGYERKVIKHIIKLIPMSSVYLEGLNNVCSSQSGASN